jgi:hypothetical protein
MKKVLLLCLLMLCASPIFAQQQTGGNITTAGSDCSVATACVTLQLAANAASVTIFIPASPSFSGTVQFEAAGGGQTTTFASVNAFPPNSTTPVTSATAAGTWTIAVAGMTAVRVRASALASGTVSVGIQSSIAIAIGTVSGGGGGGGCSPSATAGQVLYSPAGTDCGGVPGSIADTNGAVTLAPTGTGVALTLTGDANGSDIFDANINGASGGTSKFDFRGELILAPNPAPNGALNIITDTGGNYQVCGNLNGSSVGTCDAWLVDGDGNLGATSVSIHKGATEGIFIAADTHLGGATLVSQDVSKSPKLTFSTNTGGIPTMQDCGTTTSCANTAVLSGLIVKGSVALSSGAPSTATVTGINPAFTSSTSYVCTVSPQSNAATTLLSVANVDGTSFIITGPATVTTVINYICTGN